MLTDQDKTDLRLLIETAVASANEGFASRLDGFEQEAAERLGKLEEAIGEVKANSSAVLEAVLGLQIEVTGLGNRVTALTRDITTGRTRDTERVTALERRVAEIESLLQKTGP